MFSVSRTLGARDSCHFSNSHTLCIYGTDGVGGGMMTFLALVHMYDATEMMGWGGMMMMFLALAHMYDATELMGLGG